MACEHDSSVSQKCKNACDCYPSVDPLLAKLFIYGLIIPLLIMCITITFGPMFAESVESAKQRWFELFGNLFTCWYIWGAGVNGPKSNNIIFLFTIIKVQYPNYDNYTKDCTYGSAPTASVENLLCCITIKSSSSFLKITASSVV